MDATYKIIGADGREYGPVTLTEVKAWIADGRIAGRTQVWRSDQGRWLAANQYQELHPEIGQIDALHTPLDAEVTAGERPVGFWARLGAYLIDTVILSVVFFIAFGSKLDFTKATTPEDIMNIIKPLQLPVMLINTLYNVALNAVFGATLGKMALGARIVNLDGSPIGIGRAVLRWLATLLSQFLCWTGYFFIPFRHDKRALHDLIAGTKVIYKRGPQ
jgi:uncharacterized RDD family membrane protein YckC